MANTIYHSISPNRVIRGETAWEKSQTFLSKICRHPLLVGRSQATINLRDNIYQDLKKIGLYPTKVELEFDCCELDLQRLCYIGLKNNCDGVIAAGGGKVLDAGKLLAERLNLPCTTIPLSAATCAGWTALANLYSPKGAFQRDQILNSCPDLLIFDHSFVKTAPERTLSSGIADALAKWYESSLISSSSNDGLVQQAIQMARVLRDQLLLDGNIAIENKNSDEWVRVSEACALTAGLISGIGGEKCRTAAAHALHNGLTHLEGCNKMLHGEIVGYGILVQLCLEETLSGNRLAKHAREQLLSYMQRIKLPTSLDDIGLANASLNQLNHACERACIYDSEIHFLPFEVNPEDLIRAMLNTNSESKEINPSILPNIKHLD